MKRTVFRFIALILVMALIIPYTAMAAEYDLSAGSITVTGDSDSQSVTHGESAPVVDNAPVITQSSAVTENTITLDGTVADVNVTIQDVNIDTGSSGEAGITTSGDVTIQVSGENSITSEDTAIQASGELTITGVPDNTAADDSTTDDDTNPDANANTGTNTDTGDDTSTGDEDKAEENTLLVNGGNTGINVDDANANDGELVIGSDVTVTANGGITGVDADVIVDGGNLNAYGEVYGNSTESGIGIDGDLTVNSGEVAAYGNDTGVDGNVTVGTGDTQTPAAVPSAKAIVHGGKKAVSGERKVKDTGKLIQKDSTTYVPESSGTMFFGHTDSNFDIQGKYKDIEAPLKTTYSNRGYYTYVRTDDKTSMVDVRNEAAVKDTGLNIQIQLVPVKSGQLLKIVYTVTNTSSDSVTFDLGTGADVMIGSADNATITPISGNTGFMMTNEKEGYSDYGASFAFFGKGYEGVTDVDQFWYGPYSSSYHNEYYWSGNQSNAVFFGNENSVNGSFDSAASWSWLDEEIAPDQTLTYSVLLGVGDADELKDAAGDNELIPEPEPEPEPKPNPEPPIVGEPTTGTTKAPVKNPAVLDVKLDTVKEPIDLLNGTQAGKAMPIIASEAILSSGKAIEEDFTIVVRQVSTHAENTVEDLTKDTVGMVFTVACIRNNSVVAMPGKTTLSITAPEGDLDGYILVFVQEDGSHIQIPYTLVDGKLVFETAQNGLYMLIKQ